MQVPEIEFHWGKKHVRHFDHSRKKLIYHHPFIHMNPFQNPLFPGQDFMVPGAYPTYIREKGLPWTRVGQPSFSSSPWTAWGWLSKSVVQSTRMWNHWSKLISSKERTVNQAELWFLWTRVGQPCLGWPINLLQGCITNIFIKSFIFSTHSFWSLWTWTQNYDEVLTNQIILQILIKKWRIFRHFVYQGHNNTY